jgi:uncharacterized protein
MASGSEHRRRAEAVFTRLTQRPWLAVLIGFLITACAAAGLPRLVKDTSVEAFIPQDHPSVQVRDDAEQLFGLRDPIIVALLTGSRDGIFEAGVLERLRTLHEAIADLDNVRADRVLSLASESSISGTDLALEIDPYLPDGPIDTVTAESVRQRVASMPPHDGILVSADGAGALIIVEVRDQALAGETYHDIMDLARDARGDGLEIHVAGQAAVAGYLSRYIDQDARRLQPAAILVILLVVFLAFLSARAVLGPLLVVVGAAAGTIGAMAWAGTPYYAITSALPVVIIAIAVADAIHIMTRFYELRAEQPESHSRELVVRATADMWKPVTLTTLTTAAGFIGIATTSTMPPITLFGWYAALGVLLAWLYSLYALPNLMILLRLEHSRAFGRWRSNHGDLIARGLTKISLLSARRPGAAIGMVGLVAVAAALGAGNLRIDRSLVANFSEREPIRIADDVLNEHFPGSSMLDVVVRTDRRDGLLNAERMQEVATLQEFMEALPFVGKTVGITDYLAQLHRVLQPEQAESGDSRPLPDNDDAIAQYLLMYESSGDPTELEDEIDLDYQSALVRGFMTSSLSSEERPVVEALQEYLETNFNQPGMTGQLSGRVNVDYHWMQRLADSHFHSLAVSLLLILGAATVLFRSPLTGIVAMLPVSFAILCIYGVMGVSTMYLEPSTSMFAAISLGLGVDYAIHLIARVRRNGRDDATSPLESIAKRFPAANRACFFNAAALAAGFCVLLLSELATLQRFGGLIAVAAISGFACAMVIIPAIFSLRSAAYARFRGQAEAVRVNVPSLAVLAAAAVLASPAGMETAHAADALPRTAREVAERVAARPVGSSARREMEITLVDRRGKSRTRTAVVLRKTVADVEQIRFTFTSPKAIRNTTFLSHREAGAGSNGRRWLYLPATGKVRRIPASSRGDYFLGTDFTYEDIDSQLKFDLSDYRFEWPGQAPQGEADEVLIRGTPVSDSVRRELGYGGFSAAVDRATWMPRRIEFLDPRGELLKTVRVLEPRQVEGIWEPRAVAVENHQTGHSSEFRYTRTELEIDVPDEMLLPTGIDR